MGIKMFKSVAIVLFVATVEAVDFEIVNKENQVIWVGILGNYGKEIPARGGFALGAGESRTITVAPDWAGRLWGRTWCDPDTGRCDTGDCGSRLECLGAGGAAPASLAEITLGGADGIDFYDVSLVDGFNTPISFEPVNGQGDDGQYSCKKAACEFDLDAECPEELQMRTEHGVVACKSACLAFNTDEYCCRGDHDRPETCRSSDWPVDYPSYFKIHCPDAYSYAYDDNRSTFTCHSEKYVITFGS